ncbi:MAG TPA: DnaJ C-terminal domain-containing protein, partial [Desulfobaccales bacterium]
LVIPPGTRPGEVDRIRGEGVPYPKGSRKGDLLVTVRVVVPRHLTPRQQHLLDEMAKEEGTEAPSQARPGQEHEEGILRKLWHSFTSHKSN